MVGWKTLVRGSLRQSEDVENRNCNIIFDHRFQDPTEALSNSIT